MRFAKGVVIPNRTVNEELDMSCIDGIYVSIGQD